MPKKNKSLDRLSAADGGRRFAARVRKDARRHLDVQRHIQACRWLARRVERAIGIQVPARGRCRCDACCRFARTASRAEPTHPNGGEAAVWKRDQGKCVECGSTDNLHFDHIIPYSRGGSSLVADNIQLMCARHNLAKHDKIQ